MNVLVVYAHPEGNSFNAALKEKTVSILGGTGNKVAVSDLNEMDFKPALDTRDFLELENPASVNYLMEQRNASAKGLFAPDIKAEQEKVTKADLVVIHFPVWWFSAPAILKGWFDRVLAAGFAWDFGKIYKDGLLPGKKGMLVVTTGGNAQIYSKDGLHGTDMDQVLYHINHGVLYFCGMRVLPPFVAYSAFQVGDEGRRRYLEEYEARLKKIDSLEPIRYP
jgi:NAD(P)H dehydrogenase (quinone)